MTFCGILSIPPINQLFSDCRVLFIACKLGSVEPSRQFTWLNRHLLPFSASAFWLEPSINTPISIMRLVSTAKIPS